MALGLPLEEFRIRLFRGQPMAELTHNVEQEFWQPPAVMPMSSQPQDLNAVPALSDACDRCASEYLVGTRFLSRLRQAPRPSLG